MNNCDYTPDIRAYRFICQVIASVLIIAGASQARVIKYSISQSLLVFACLETVRYMSRDTRC